MPSIDRQNPLMPGGNPEIYRPLFLRIYSISGNITESAQIAGITPSQVRAAIRQDPDFAALVQDAKEDAVDVLEKEVWRRALSGSDLLAMFVLKKERPEYRDRVLPQTATQINVKAYVGFSPDDWDKHRDQLTVDSTSSVVDDNTGTTTDESDFSLSASALADSATP